MPSGVVKSHIGNLVTKEGQKMQRIFNALSSAAAVLGIVLGLFAGGFRLSGSFYVAGFEAMTLFNVGVGLMVFSALVKLELLLRRSN
jgi:hypothetical protein